MTAGLPRLTYVEINGIDVSSYLISWTMEDVFEKNIGSVKINLSQKAYTLLTFNNNLIGDAVIIKRGVSSATETTLFRGIVTNVFNQGSVSSIDAFDELKKAVDAEVTYSYDYEIDASAGQISEIFKDLFDTYTTLTADATSVQDSGTSFILKKFICNHSDVYTKASELANLIDWQFFYRASTDKVYFEPKGFTSSSTILTVVDNIVNVPKWARDSTKMVNKMTVIGAVQEVETTEEFNGDGSTDEFTLTQTPVSVRVEVGGTLQVGGKEGATSTYDYEVDAENKKIKFVAGSIPASGTNNVDVIYSYYAQAPVVGEDSTSISLYGEVARTFFKPDIPVIADAEAYVQKYLEKYHEPFVYSTVSVTNVTDLAVGEIVRVIDTINQPNMDSYFLVSRIRRSWPYRFDEVTLGDETWKTAEWGVKIAQRIRKLEEENGKFTDFLVHVVSATPEVQMIPRYYSTENRSVISDALIWNNTTYGIWGTGEWANDSDLGDYTIIRMQQYNQTYS